MKVIERYKLVDLAIELKKVIKQRKDNFKPITIVIPNSKLQQWFNAYWLKTESDILMNIKYVIIDDLLMNILNSDKHYRIIKKDILKSLIMKFLSEKKDIIELSQNIKEYCYMDDGNINDIKIYDLANQLSDLYFEYEQDFVEMNGWQKNLYEMVMEYASNYNLSTLGYMFSTCKNIKKLDNELYFFGFTNYTKLQSKIIQKYACSFDVTMMTLIHNDNFEAKYSITGAPSKLREIEDVHSKICTLLKDSTVKYSDFLILAPEISAYEGIIPRVFNQNNVDFPNIPFSINDIKRVVTNVSNGISKLFEIINKKFYTRLDFFNLINNEDIKKARSISDEDIANWSESLIKKTVYRNGEHRDDWQYAKMRLLCSKIAEINDIDNNILEINNNSYIPFTTIAFDDESIVKFIKIVDDLSSLITMFNQIVNINKDNLISLKYELDKWFSIKDKNGFETNGYYLSIINILESWTKMNISDNSIPINALFYTLLDGSKVTNFSREDYFTRGITFSDFDLNAILSAKYVFFLNCGSKEFPKIRTKSELDLRNYDISNIEQIQKSFISQYQNSEEHLFISYINKDLKTDEDLYPSSLVYTLKTILNVEINNISIDENRSWDKLFTQREYKNKNYYLGLLSSKNNFSNNEQEILVSEKQKRISVRNIANFLEEPLMYKTKRLFGRSDTLEDEINEEFEPFLLDNLTSSSLINNICVDILANKYNFSDQILELLKERYNLEHKLPNINPIINDSIFLDIINECKKIIENVEKVTLGNYDLKRLDNLKFKNSLGEEWELTCDKEVCVSVDGLTRTYLELKKNIDKFKDNEYRFLFLYAYSLMDVCNKPEQEYTIILNKGVAIQFNITPSEAKLILIEIYELMNDYTDNVYLPFKKINNSKITTLYSLIDDLKQENNSPWSYFDDKKLFDYETQLGYTQDNFESKYNEKKKKLSDLVKFITLTKREDESNE